MTFSAVVDAELIDAVRDLAHVEGKPVESVIAEALTEFISRRSRPQARPHVMAKYHESLVRFGPLYERLAG